ADLEVAHLGLEHHGAAHHLAEADVAVGRLGHDARARLLDGDAAVGGVEPQVAGGRAHPGGAVGVLDHRAVAQFAHAHVARPRGDLGTARHAGDLDVTAAALELDRLGAVEPDVAEP